MKVSTDCGRYSHPNRDKELGAFENHPKRWEQCTTVPQELAEAGELSQRLRRARPLYPLPDTLRERLLHALKTAKALPPDPRKP